MVEAENQELDQRKTVFDGNGVAGDLDIVLLRKKLVKGVFLGIKENFSLRQGDRLGVIEAKPLKSVHPGLQEVADEAVVLVKGQELLVEGGFFVSFGVVVNPNEELLGSFFPELLS